MDTSSRPSLSVVDNPTGTPTTYNLVSNQTIPSASGKIGMFTWGMAGGTPSGFRIQNLNLSPVGLAGNFSSLTNWSAVIPPRAVGSSATLTSTSLWSRAIGGSAGVLTEMGDSFAGNDTAGQIDFTGPTLVTGNDTWTNYTMAARITPFDDDGQGILLR